MRWTIRFHRRPRANQVLISKYIIDISNTCSQFRICTKTNGWKSKTLNDNVHTICQYEKKWHTTMKKSRLIALGKSWALLSISVCGLFILFGILSTPAFSAYQIDIIVVVVSAICLCQPYALLSFLIGQYVCLSVSLSVTI